MSIVSQYMLRRSASLVMILAVEACGFRDTSKQEVKLDWPDGIRVYDGRMVECDRSDGREIMARWHRAESLLGETDSGIAQVAEETRRAFEGEAVAMAETRLLDNRYIMAMCLIGGSVDCLAVFERIDDIETLRICRYYALGIR